MWACNFEFVFLEGLLQYQGYFPEKGFPISFSCLLLGEDLLLDPNSPTGLGLFGPLKNHYTQKTKNDAGKSSAKATCRKMMDLDDLTQKTHLDKDNSNYLKNVIGGGPNSPDEQ